MLQPHLRDPEVTGVRGLGLPTQHLWRLIHPHLPWPQACPRAGPGQGSGSGSSARSLCPAKLQAPRVAPHARFLCPATGMLGKAQPSARPPRRAPPTDTQQGQETPMLFWAWPFLQHRPTCPDQRSFRCREPHSKNHKGETSPGSVRRGVRRGPRERARLCAPACVKMHVMYECTRVYVPECIHVCLRVHPLVCMCLCSHTCLYVCACICLGLCVHTCTYVCACMTPMRVCV